MYSECTSTHEVPAPEGALLNAAVAGGEPPASLRINQGDASAEAVPFLQSPPSMRFCASCESPGYFGRLIVRAEARTLQTRYLSAGGA